MMALSHMYLVREVLAIDIFSSVKCIKTLINFLGLWFNTEEHLWLTAFKG